MCEVMKIRIELFKTIQCTWKRHQHQYRSVLDFRDRPSGLAELRRTVRMKEMIKRNEKFQLGSESQSNNEDDFGTGFDLEDDISIGMDAQDYMNR